jgi:hypothetical protein
VRQLPPGIGLGGRGVPIVGSHYITPSVDVEDLVHVVVNCRVCELVIAL